MPVLVGTSGWQYRDWRGVLYPPGVPQRAWLDVPLRRSVDGFGPADCRPESEAIGLLWLGATSRPWHEAANGSRFRSPSGQGWRKLPCADGADPASPRPIS